jgi:hypothetical protein
LPNTESQGLGHYCRSIKSLIIHSLGGGRDWHFISPVREILLLEVDFTTAIEYYKRGFEDCADVVEQLMMESKDLDQAKNNIKLVLTTLKERKVAEIRAELGL